MYYYAGYDMGYMLIALIATGLGIITQAYIRKAYSKWSAVDASFEGTGADVAKSMLAHAGVEGVGFARVDGALTDHYDPRDNTLHLSEDNCYGGSVASIAVACHEAGHAIQHAQRYSPVQIRTALVPVVNLTQGTWSLVFLAGIMLQMTGLVRLALILFAASVLFQLVTLPVEFDASRRALAYLSAEGEAIDQRGAKEVLTAAALTYVAAALASVIQLLYLMSRTRRR
ncbi:zinc metallopeptidase [Coriobacteriales bacterium OH1046]|nr:zinc metallopeptidase [Coriobacteriales bacterium OH1046]